MEKIKFYDNKEEHGIIIDWQKVFKEYRRIIKAAKVSEPIYDPTTAPVTECKYIELLSERSSGKTTNWIIIGIILNKMYGTVTQYIRQSEDMIKPSVAGEIFRVILTYNNSCYIPLLTDGKYRGIYIHWKKAYFCNYDDNGKPCDVAPDPFLNFLSIDNNFDYKSGYNAPRGDLILFDEFIGKYCPPNEFVDFSDLTKTIIRFRKTPIIVMLANTINRNHQYFKELEISKAVKNLKVGQHTIETTEKGTRIYIEIIGLKQSAIKQEVNRLFYGFNNPKLNAITGGEIAWAFDPVPHIVNNDDDVIISRIFRIDTGDVMLQLDIVNTTDRGLIINCHECTKVYKDSVIFTLGEIRENNQIYGIGKNNPYAGLIWKLYEQNKFYYDSNESGSLVKNYLKQYRQSKYI